MARNQQLQTIVEDYAGKDGADRPDLFLGGSVLRQHLLIEFKKPAITVGREAEAQAKKYADVITGRLGLPLEIMIVGGEVDPKLQENIPARNRGFFPAAPYSRAHARNWNGCWISSIKSLGRRASLSALGGGGAESRHFAQALRELCPSPFQLAINFRPAAGKRPVPVVRFPRAAAEGSRRPSATDRWLPARAEESWPRAPG